MSTPVALLLTDTHLKKADRVEEVIGIFRHAVDVCVENDIAVILHLGDVFTDRLNGNLDNNLLPMLAVLNYLSSKRIRMIAIPGNHDKTDQTSTDSYLDVFAHHPSLDVIKTGSFAFETKDFQLFMLPYFLEKDGTYQAHLAELVKHIRTNTKYEDKLNILCTHVTVDGAKNNDGAEAKGVPRKSFEVFDQVFIGHYHNRNRIAKKFLYMGSADQMNFGDDQEKGFLILYDDGAYGFVQSRGRKFFKVVYNLPKDSAKMAKEVSKYAKKAKKGNKVRFVIHATQEEMVAVDAKGLQEQGVEVKFEDLTKRGNIDSARTKKAVKKFDKKKMKLEFIKFGASARLGKPFRKVFLDHFKDA